MGQSECSTCARGSDRGRGFAPIVEKVVHKQPDFDEDDCCSCNVHEGHLVEKVSLVSPRGCIAREAVPVMTLLNWLVPFKLDFQDGGRLELEYVDARSDFGSSGALVSMREYDIRDVRLWGSIYSIVSGRQREMGMAEAILDLKRDRNGPGADVRCRNFCYATDLSAMSNATSLSPEDVGRLICQQVAALLDRELCLADPLSSRLALAAQQSQARAVPSGRNGSGEANSVKPIVSQDVAIVPVSVLPPPVLQVSRSWQHTGSWQLRPPAVG